MPKYYVDSGTMKFVCEAANEVAAIEKAVAACCLGTKLGSLIRVNQRGFDPEHDDDLLFHTMSVLNPAGAPPG